jgi:hypothetical protein
LEHIKGTNIQETMTLYANMIRHLNTEASSFYSFQYLTQTQVLQARTLAGSEIEIACIPYNCVGRQSKISLSWLLEQQQMLCEFFEDNLI